MAEKKDWVEVPVAEDQDWKEVSLDSTTKEDKLFAQEYILEPISKAASAVESVTGAPTRSGIMAGIKGENPLAAIYQQFGEDPSKAPSGSDIAKEIGVSDQPLTKFTGSEALKKLAEYGGGVGAGFSAGLLAALPKQVKEKTYEPSTADIAGLGIDLLADPMNLLGFGEIKAFSKIPGAASAASKGAEEIGALARSFIKSKQAQKAEASAEAATKAASNISVGGSTVENSGSLFSIKKPESLEELRNWKPSREGTESIGKARLREIESSVPDLETKPLRYHYDMMENPKSMKELKLRFENLPTEDAKKIASYNQEMVNESARKVKDTINSITGKEPLDLHDAGEKFISSIKDKYQAEKSSLGPVFQSLKKESSVLKKQEAQDLIQAIGENSKVGKLLSADNETGKFYLSKNTPRSGISDSEHNVISRVIDDLNDGMSFEEIQKTREFLRKSVDPTNKAASEEVSKIRSILLGQLEHLAGSRGEDVGNAFRAYAKNERSRENIEHIIGGKIESLDSMYAANPDKIVQKIFSNPNYVNIVSDYVGNDVIKEMVSSHLGRGIKKSFDSAKGFNPTELRSWLKSNKNFLDNYVDTETSQRLRDLADYGYYGKRFLDEVNPSGTAASLLEAIKPEGFMQKIKTGDVTGAVTSEVSQRLSSKLKQKQAIAAFDEAISGIKRTDIPRGDGFLKGLENAENKADLLLTGAVRAYPAVKAVNSVQRENSDRTPQGQADVATVMQSMHPYDREQYIKKDSSLTPTQKALLLKQNRNAR